MVLIASKLIMKGGIFFKETPSNEFSLMKATETVSTNCALKLLRLNTFLIFQNFKINSLNFNLVNKGNGDCNEDVDLSKADCDLDVITDEDVNTVRFLNCLNTNPRSRNNKMHC